VTENKEHIDREAHDKSKGFRLQKLRAVEMMIDSEIMPDDTVMFWATEYKEDIFQNTEGETLLEENKCYDENSSFTFNSIEVRKALVSFIDLWIYYDYSSLLRFNFYTSNKIGKERESETTKAEKITLPPEKLIELSQEENVSDTFIEISSKFVLHELKVSYGEKSSKFKTVSKWKSKTWKEYFKLITWKFGEPNEKKLDEIVLHKIKNCKWFSSSLHEGMEDFIKSKLLDELDKRQSKPDFLNRTFSKSDVELVFEKAKSTINLKKDDPLWKMWVTIETPIDKRNVREKLISKWNNINSSEILKYSRKSVAGGIERDEFSGENDFMALRFRIYSVCEERLNSLISKNLINNWTPEECINDIFEVSKNEVQALSKTFNYSFDSETLIYNIILELFDSCYLAFDNE